MVKVLAIGNSFSQDATEHLHDIAEAGNVDMKVGNLYIGGCSLERHWQNASRDLSTYDYFENGKEIKTCSIKEALTSDEWDFITLQQVSNLSGIKDSYEPYLGNLSNYVKVYAPYAEQLLHQTWAYEVDSTHDAFTNYNSNQETMFNAIIDANDFYSKKYGLRLIPCGEAMQLARKTEPFDYPNGRSLCRDGFHASLSLGRYLLSSVWYELLTGNSIYNNPYIPSTIDGDKAPFKEELVALKESVHKTVSLYK